MKKWISLFFSLLFATSVATAAPTQSADFATFNKVDSAQLFGADAAYVMVLDNSELRATEGQFLQFLAPLIPWAIGSAVGAFSSWWTYMGTVSVNHNYSSDAAWNAAGKGALIGLVNPIKIPLTTATTYSIARNFGASSLGSLLF